MKKTFIVKTVLGVIFAIVSLKLLLGAILGYTASQFYSNKIYGKPLGKFSFMGKSIYIPFGRYKIHMHHWLYPSLILGGGVLFDVFFLAFYFPVGVLLGMVIHDIATDKHWHRVIIPR